MHGAPLLSGTQICLPYIFYRIKLMLLTILVGNLNDPAVIQIGKPATRRAELQPGLEESCLFLHLDK